ncbi:helix-turn-helix domain-containing protein [Thioclava nitratireducens]|uniref:arsenate reductase/protein-tyrosine-phosphatase family protein n=1 Tax=Thioclava nitratireducens TaxID=1915078 RepID=UPI00247FC80E|nr:helix-turn-helix domain-containing protein [Thioclava nitratireducens]WGT49934.1 helix-turn-helix domain-containing protein [Thioclava nitratireducens]
MDEMTPQRLTVLGHAQRLAIFRLLMRRYPDQLPAGEIGAALGLKPSTLSAYLAALAEVGLIGQTRAGTSLRYGIEMETVRNLFDALLIDCCQGRPDICSPLTQPDPSGDSRMTQSATGRKFNVLFICTGNSARSILAETILRDRAGDRFKAYSAGTKPYSELNPFAVQVLRDKGHDVEPLRAKNISEFHGEDAPVLDFVFTVCDLAANEECPPWPGQPISGHWGMPDPVKATGTEAERALAFQQAYGALHRRIEAFAALPLSTLDRIALQSAVDDIGRN